MPRVRFKSDLYLTLGGKGSERDTSAGLGAVWHRAPGLTGGREVENVLLSVQQASKPTESRSSLTLGTWPNVL